MIVKQDTAAALKLMKEVSDWLNTKRLRLWNSRNFENGRILKSADNTRFFTAFIGDKPVAAMILLYNDPVFWPKSIDDSGFIYKFCVARDYAGRGISADFIAWAKKELQAQGRSFLRLHCAADRPKLCKVYENLGFVKVDRRKIGRYDIAFYEMVIERS